MAGKTLIAGSLVLAVLIVTGWWLYAEFVAPEAAKPAEASFTARLDAYLQGGGRAELVSNQAGSGPGPVEVESSVDGESTTVPPEDQPGVDGLVIDETGAAVGGARVEVLWWPRRAGDDSKQIDVVIKTARDGTFRVAIPEGESRRLRVIEQDTRAADPMSASAAEIVESDVGEITLRVQRAPNLGGRYVDEDGQPLTYKRVLIFEGDYVKVTHVETDWEGHFEVRVPPELDLVHVKAGKLVSDEQYSGRSLGEIQYDVPVGTRDLLLTSRKSRWLTGSVRGSDGEPLRAASIWVKRVDEHVGSYVQLGRGVFEGRRAQRVHTGVYRVGPLRPGEYSIYVDPRVSGYARSAEVRVRVPSPTIELMCPTTTGIRGFVRGKQFPATFLYWDAGDHPMGRMAGRVQVGIDGGFEIPCAPHVAHRLHVHDSRGQTASLEGVLPGDEGVELKLKPGLSISGSVTDPETLVNGWVAASQGGIQIPASWDEKGRFEIKGLTAGDWHVHMYRLGVSADQQPRGVRVAAGTEGVRLGD